MKTETSPAKKEKLTTYRFKPEDAALLHQKAQTLGLSDTAYLRTLIHGDKPQKTILTFDDLRALIANIQSILDVLARIANTLEENKNEPVPKETIARILTLSEEIKSLLHKQIRLTLNQRDRLYKKTTTPNPKEQP